MSDYNYDRFSAEHYALSNFQGPQSGQKAPAFDLILPDGTPKSLLDFDGEFLVLELGSITCPLFQSRRNSMTAMVTAHPDVAFAILYVREAHPGARFTKHNTDEDKRNNARALYVDDAETRTIFVDNIAGTAHKAYGGFPNSVFIINKNGCVVFYADWNNPNATGKALRALKAGKPASGMGLFLPPKPPVALKTLREAGAGAAPDFFKSLPKLIWENLIKRNLRLLMGKKVTVPADAQC